MIDYESQLAEQIKEAQEELKIDTSIETKDEVVSEDSSSPQSDDQYLEEALRWGYDPNYKGANKKTPEQYVKDGSYFKKIDKQKHQIDDLSKSLDETKTIIKQMSEESKQLKKAGYEQALRDLEAREEAAVREGDVDSFKVLKKQREAVEQFQKISETPVKSAEDVKPQITPEESEFIERNKDWCNTESDENKLMYGAASQLCGLVAEEARLKGETIDTKEQLNRVEEKVKRLFPHRFENPNKSRPSAVGVSTVGTGVKGNTLANRLSKEQRDFAKQARNYGSSMSDEEYAQQLLEIGRLSDE
ncbi:MAG TPA: hypothetical protein VGK47_07465 [Nitrososphaeraceae archaeon]